jgi:glycosyltransferase involved in cell wall biosynthesis
VVHAHRYYDILRGWTIKRKVPGSKLVLYQQCYLNHPNSLPLSMTDGILCISDFVKRSITSSFPELEGKTTVVNPGVDLALFDRAKKGYATEGPVKIGMVGRFDKNQEELLEIGGMLKRKGFRISIHLVGEGTAEEEDNLRSVADREGIGGETHFRGIVLHDEIPPFYREMDIMASTMKNEGLSLVAMEAMASGVPFVAYGSSGFTELIDNGENGILVDGDACMFADCLTKLIESEDLRKEMGTRAAEKGKSHFGMDLNVEKYLTFIEKLFD